MPNKSLPFSVRLSQEDADFIAMLSVPGAVTPSDKIRHIITEARLSNQNDQTFNQRLKSEQDAFAPAIERLRDLERETGRESEFLHYLGTWLGETKVDYVQGPTDADDLEPYEDRLYRQVAKLTDYVMRLAMTTDAPCINPNLFQGSAHRLIELADILKTVKKGDTQ